MYVDVIVESKDYEDCTANSRNTALYESVGSGCKLTYSEELSDTDEPTKTTMLIDEKNVRIIRDGNFKADFWYSLGMVHNSEYVTPFGNFPVQITTTSFEYDEGDSEDIIADIKIEYTMSLMETKPMNYSTRVWIKRLD